MHNRPHFVCLLVALSAGCSREPSPPPLLPVKVQRVGASEATQTLTATGEIRAQVESKLGFRINGQVSERLAEVGDRVAPGQLLAKLDQAEVLASIAAAEAVVRSAEAKLRTETSDLEREKYLLATKANPPSAFDAAEEAFRIAQSDLDAAIARLGTARDALAQTELRADHAGTLTARLVEVGQVVTAGQPAFILAHDGPRDAVFHVEASIFSDQPIDRTVPVVIQLLADQAVRTTGTVREVTPTLSGAGGTLTFKIGLTNLPPSMALGAAVLGRGPVPQGSRHAYAIPSGALASVGGLPGVWIVDPASCAVSARPISVARYETDRVIVASGLRPGELVVTHTVQKMSPNRKVAYTEEENP